MLQDIVDAKLRGDYRLWLRFEDGTEGEVELGPRLTFQGVFEPLRDPAYFARVRVDPGLGPWSGRMEPISNPDVLYAEVTGRHPLEGFQGSQSRNASLVRRPA